MTDALSQVYGPHSYHPVVMPDEGEVLKEVFERAQNDPAFVKRFRGAVRDVRNASRFARERVPDDAPDWEKRRKVWLLWYVAYDPDNERTAARFVPMTSKTVDMSEEWVISVLADVISQP